MRTKSVAVVVSIFLVVTIVLGVAVFCDRMLTWIVENPEALPRVALVSLPLSAVFYLFVLVYAYRRRRVGRDGSLS